MRSFSGTPTSITLEWELPDPRFQNGDITQHRIVYRKAETNFDQIKIISATTRDTLTDLDIFTSYSISVSSGTDIGFSTASSTPAMVRTLNDSKTGTLDAYIYNIY